VTQAFHTPVVCRGCSEFATPAWARKSAAEGSS
jgi:hypothetical protein